MSKGVPITQEKIKSRKRKRRFWLSITFLVCFFLCIAGLSFVSSLDAFQIKHIEISGNIMTNSDDIAAVAENSLVGESFWIFPHSDIFFVSSKKIAADIAAAYPSLERVSVSKRFFSTIVVTVEEKNPSALWCLNTACDFLDSSGTSFEKATSSATSSLIVFGNGDNPEIGTPLLPADEFVPLLIFINDLPQRGVYPFAVNIAEDDEVKIAVATSTYIIVDPTKDLSQSLANLDRLFMDKSSGINADTISNLQYLDLRFPDKIFYK